jgi:hypothetical protein
VLQESQDVFWQRWTESLDLLQMAGMGKKVKKTLPHKYTFFICWSERSFDVLETILWDYWRNITLGCKIRFRLFLCVLTAGVQ